MRMVYKKSQQVNLLQIMAPMLAASSLAKKTTCRPTDQKHDTFG